jgi:hypothetical protein
MGRFRADGQEWFWSLLGLADEVVDLAISIEADYVSARLPRGGKDQLTLIYDQGIVWLEGRDFGVELRCRLR